MGRELPARMVRYRRISPIAAPSGDGLLSEPKAFTHPRQREPLFVPRSPTSSAAGGLARVDQSLRAARVRAAERAQTELAGKGPRGTNTRDQRSPRHHCASGTIAHSARRVLLCALNVVEDREATRDDPGEALAVGRSLPGLAHRDEWYVLPHLHLQFRRNATLLGKIAGIEPGATQFLDARAVGPAVVSGLAVGPQIRIAEWVDVRDRAIDQREENVPSALVRRRLACPPLDDGAEFHLLQIDIEPGAAQLVGADQAERMHDVGRCYDNDRLTAVTGLCKLLFGSRRITGPPQDVDPGVVGER